MPSSTVNCDYLNDFEGFKYLKIKTRGGDLSKKTEDRVDGDTSERGSSALATSDSLSPLVPSGVENALKTEDVCRHLSMVDEKSMVFCGNCGQELGSDWVNRIHQVDGDTKTTSSYSESQKCEGSLPRWSRVNNGACHDRLSVGEGNRTFSLQYRDLGRYQKQKHEPRNILRDVENMNFGDKIVSMANDIYLTVTDGQIFRGNSRRSIIFGSVYHAFKIAGNPQSCEYLIKLFSLKRKGALHGLKYINNAVSKDSPIKTIHVDSSHTILELLQKFQPSRYDIEQVLSLHEQTKDKSSLLNRCRPQSTAAGLVYYYILRTKKNITLKEFTKKIDLSELTIKKIVKEIDRLLETQLAYSQPKN